MKIAAIKNSPNFKGLWGEPQKTFAGNEHTSLSFITKTYYPFKNESKESIEETKKVIKVTITQIGTKQAGHTLMKKLT